TCRNTRSASHRVPQFELGGKSRGGNGGASLPTFASRIRLYRRGLQRVRDRPSVPSGDSYCVRLVGGQGARVGRRQSGRESIAASHGILLVVESGGAARGDSRYVLRRRRALRLHPSARVHGAHCGAVAAISALVPRGGRGGGRRLAFARRDRISGI